MPGGKYFRYFNYSPGGEPPPDDPNIPVPEPSPTPEPPGSNCCIKAICVANENDINKFDDDGHRVKCCTPIVISAMQGYEQGELQVLGHIKGDSCLTWINVTVCEDEPPPSTTEEPTTEEPGTTTQSPG